jgi:2-dehydropantoate 2-reductase
MLRKAGFPVHFLARSDAAALRTGGLRVLSPRGDFHLPQVDVYERPENMPPCDAALVAWKTTSNAALAAALPLALKPGGVAVILQNGLNPESEAVAAMAGAKILSGLCFLCCRKATPALVEHQDSGSITFAAHTPSPEGKQIPPWVLEIASDFRQAGIEIRAENDWKAARWKKLVWNIPFNGLTALLGLDTAQVMARPSLLQLTRDLMEETLAAARLDGVTIDPGFVDKMLDATRVMRPYEPSMKLDRDAGRPMELQAIYGDVLDLVASKGGRAPALHVLYALLRGADSTLR